MSLPYGIFFSAITSLPIEQAVVLPSGDFVDVEDIRLILTYKNPWLSPLGPIIDGALTQWQGTSLAQLREQICTHYLKKNSCTPGEIPLVLAQIPRAKFLQPTIDNAYHLTGWPLVAERTESGLSTAYENRDTIIQGEFARCILLELKKLWKQERYRDITYSVWSDAMMQQVRLIHSFKDLDQSLCLSHLTDRTRTATSYIKAVDTIFTLSHAALNPKMLWRLSTELKQWHRLICGNDNHCVRGNMYQRITGSNSSPAQFTDMVLDTPFDLIDEQAMNKLLICHCSGKPAQNPIFYFGYLYNREDLWCTLQLKGDAPWKNYQEFCEAFPVLQHFKVKQTERIRDKFKTKPPVNFKPISTILPSRTPSETIEELPISIESVDYLQNYLPLQAQFTQMGTAICIHAQVMENRCKYNDNLILPSELDKELRENLKNLQHLGIISKFWFDANRVFLFGYNESAVLEQGNLARNLLATIIQRTEDNHQFKRHVYFELHELAKNLNLPTLDALITALSRREHMDAFQDSGTLPTHVFFQRLSILSDNSSARKHSLNTEIRPTDTDKFVKAFSYIRSALNVIEIARQGVNSSTTLADKQTKDWYNLFTTIDFKSLTEKVSKWGNDINVGTDGYQLIQ